MAIPTNPTATSIVTEALKKANIYSPTATELSRASDEFLEEVKNDIWNRALANGDTRLVTLQTQNVQISVANKSAYSFPSDFDSELSVEILDGEHTGTAQAGAASSITCAADEDITVANAEGKYILITGGTGSGGLRQVIDYDSTTKVATVDSSWATNPDATSTYLFVDSFHDLEEGHILDLNQAQNRTTPGLPSEYYRVNEGVNSKFYFDRPTDKSTYGIRIRYYAAIGNVDLTEGSTLISKIYKNWQFVLKQGVYCKQLEADDDNLYATAKNEYERMVNNLIIREIPYGGEFEGFEV